MSDTNFDVTPDPATLRRVIFASVIGAVIEWYDFFLYGVVAGIVLNKLYFPTNDPSLSTLLAYATFGVGFITRPLGGLIFGHFGDKIGRKSVLIITIMVMGFSTLAIGLVPTYAQIGVWAPILLLLFRLIQGIGLGGEWGGAILLAYEYAPARLRGFYTSLPQIGLSGGVILSAGFIAGMSALLTEKQFLAWGWRLGFGFSVCLVAVGLWIRLRIMETPEFIRVRQSQKRVKLPIAEVLQRFSGNLLLGLGARHLDGVFFNIFSVFMVSYLTTTIHLSRGNALFGVMIGAAVLSICMPLWGRISDRVSRPRLYCIVSLITACISIPAFWLINAAHGNVAIVWGVMAVVFGMMYSAVYGNTSTVLCDLFDARVRYTGISTVYQFSSILAGGFTPIIAVQLVRMDGGQPWYICGYIVVSGLISGGCSFAMDRRAKAANQAGVEHYSDIRKAS
jgi:MFS transporter, MHS family, shikimate and dehydroshikimate transport protein